MEIRCKKGDCEYNTGCSCKAKVVKIDDTTAECLSYQKNPIKENIIIENGNIFDVAEQMVAKNTNNVPLTCSATNCLYNRNEKCVANGITVIDSATSNSETPACCATYIED